MHNFLTNMFPAYAYLSAYDRHKKLINDYLLLKGETVASLKRDTYVYVLKNVTFILIVRRNMVPPNTR